VGDTDWSVPSEDKDCMSQPIAVTDDRSPLMELHTLAES
jgi:hypothetical protein